ncbi:MAG: replicative DNA helicase [Proteobacteria bacterium]|nr:replicative DNA helicase [Pseudomonadota bacterium]
MAEAKKGRGRPSRKAEDLKLPPQSLEAEQFLLGAVLRDNAALPRVLESRLAPEDFYREAHGLIFGSMRDLFDAAEPVDLLTLHEALKKAGALEKVGGPAYLAELSDAVATAANVEYYAGIIRDRSTLRRLISTSSRIADHCYSPTSAADEVLDLAESSIFSIREGRDQQTLQPVKGLLAQTIGHVEAMFTRGESVTGVPTGFKDLDDLTGGFQPSDLIILAGRPSMGKTALAPNLAAQTAIPEERDVKGGQPFATAFFSLEMSTDQVLMRLLCSLGRLDLRDVRTGRLRQEDFIHLTDAASKLNEAPIYVDDTPALGVLEMRAKTRRLKSQLTNQGLPLGLVIVDYLQLMRGRGYTDSREQEISEISRSLKALAKELQVPVVALSQLNRRVEERPDKRPILADLRESGAIEQDADVIAFVYREEVYKKDNEELRGVAELIIGKQRNGPVGRIHLSFNHPSARFRTASARDDAY